MKASKAKKVEEFRRWLIDNDIQFVEHPNGCFRIYKDAEHIMDYWATTEKFMVVGGMPGVGVHLVKKHIEEECAAPRAN